MLSPRIRRKDEGGIVAINLVLFLGFALYAVVQLTRTTLAAQQIDCGKNQHAPRSLVAPARPGYEVPETNERSSASPAVWLFSG